MPQAKKNENKKFVKAQLGIYSINPAVGSTIINERHPRLNASLDQKKAAFIEEAGWICDGLISLGTWKTIPV